VAKSVRSCSIEWRSSASRSFSRLTKIREPSDDPGGGHLRWINDRGFLILLSAALNLGLQPVIEFIGPVIAAGTLLFRTEAVAASTKNMSFRFVACEF